MDNKDKYTYRVEWSEEDSCFISKCLEFPSLLAHGNTKVKALKELDIVIKSTLKWMGDEGEQIPLPLSLKTYKGNISLRVSPDTHREIAMLSAEQNVSLNQLITTLIEKNLFSNQLEANVRLLESQIMNLTTEVSNIKNYNTLLSSQLLHNKSVDYDASRSLESKYFEYNQVPGFVLNSEEELTA